MRRAFHIAGKDVRIWVRDVAAMGVLVGMPIILILILGSALGGAQSGELGVKLVVVNLDEGALPSGQRPSGGAGGAQNIGDELTEALTSGGRLGEVLDAEVGSDVDAELARAAQGDLAAVVVVPRDFTRRVMAAEQTEIVVYEDPGQPSAADVAESVVRSIADRYAAVSIVVQTVMRVGEEQAAPGAWTSEAAGRSMGVAVSRATADGALDVVKVVETSTSPDVELTALDYYGPSMTAMFLMFGAMFGAFATIRERREQTLARLLATPTGGTAVTAGKMLGIFALGILQFAVLYFFTRFVFGVRWGGDFLATWLVAAAEILAVTGLAVLIASLARTERGAGGLGPLIIQIQALIGGAFFALTILPVWLQPIRYFSVIGWTLEGWSRVQLEGAGVSGVLGPVGALLGFALVFFALGSWLMGRRA